MTGLLALVAAIPWPALWLLTGLLGGLVVTLAGHQQLAQFAIMTAFKATQQLLGEGISNVSNEDLAAIAHSAYGALPSVVVVGGLPLPVGLLKQFVSEAQFQSLVQREYATFKTAYAQALTDKQTGYGLLKPSPVRATVAVVRENAQAPAQAQAAQQPVTFRAATPPQAAVVQDPAPAATADQKGTG